MGWPSWDAWRTLLSDKTRQAADEFSAVLQGYLSTEHKDDGSHGDIHADSIEVSGDVSIDGTINVFNGRDFAQGVTQNEPFLAANFNTGGGGTWVVGSADQETFSYVIIGDRLFVTARLFHTTITLTPSVLTIVMPGGFQTAESVSLPCTVADNGVDTPAYVTVATTVPGTIFITLANAATFATAANTTNVDFQINFKVA